VLQRIVSRRRERYPAATAAGEAIAPASPFTGSSSPWRASDNRFLSALHARRGRAVIAEVKMGSPRIGSLVGRFDPDRQAELYAEHGAAALSVVVEPDYFFGSYALLSRCVAASGLPAIAKDFVVSERQLDEAAEAGAAAMLLVAALYSNDELRFWASAARRRGLVPLVETHDAADVARLGGAEGGWELVGVNNRDLRTFEVDLEASMRLRRRLPSGALAVAESGIARRADVERLAAAGFDAFLVGESLLTAEDPARTLRELTR
jgi:indole-3-glycerol phosphate synthase